MTRPVDSCLSMASFMQQLLLQLQLLMVSHDSVLVTPIVLRSLTCPGVPVSVPDRCLLLTTTATAVDCCSCCYPLLLLLLSTGAGLPGRD